MKAATAELGGRILVPPSTAHWMTRALYAYWLGAMRRARAAAAEAGTLAVPDLLPGRQHIDPVDIPRLLANVWMLDVTGAPRRYRFRLIGGALDNAGLPQRKGDFMDDHLPAAARADGLAELDFIVDQRLPVWFRGPAYLPHNRQLFELERLIVPLAADGIAVDILLALSVFYDSAGLER